MTKVESRGIYNVEYFSGTQASIYIGDIWVDEITEISYAVQQSRTPIFGYASQLWDDVSEGQVIVQGQFTINFKEAGYMFLVLNHYRQQMVGGKSLLTPFEKPGDLTRSGSLTRSGNIEALINNEGSIINKNRELANIAAEAFQSETRINQRNVAQASLTGNSSIARLRGRSDIAENSMEAFEDAVWSRTQDDLDNLDRRADTARLNPFDIYVTFGDFAGDNSVNHTVEKISDVMILGKAKSIVVDGTPIQEQYSFIARNLV